eukprot:scaffold2658_cov51-Phaeocystis_antarctica.AAC.1
MYPTTSGPSGSLRMTGAAFRASAGSSQSQRSDGQFGGLKPHCVTHQTSVTGADTLTHCVTSMCLALGATAAASVFLAFLASHFGPWFCDSGAAAALASSRHGESMRESMVSARGEGLLETCCTRWARSWGGATARRLSPG